MASNTVAPSPEDSQDQLGASTVSPDGLDTTPAENPTEDSAEPKKKSRRKLRKKQDKPEFDNLNMRPCRARCFAVPCGGNSEKACCCSAL